MATTVLAPEEATRSYDNALVKEVEEIDFTTLVDVFEGDQLSITVREFCPPFICEHIADRIRRHPEIGAYVVEPKFFRFGRSFYDAAKDPGQLEAYFDEARHHQQELRKLSGPYLHPLDELRCTLDAAWPFGATIATLNGRRMKAGTARLCKDGGGAEVHVDSLGFDASVFGDAPALQKQVSANLYLQMPDEGGELDIWDMRIVAPEEEDALRLPGHKYCLDRDKLGPPAVTIHPQVGQLVIFDSNRPHAVRPSFGGYRITMALFIGYSGEKPLILWN